MYPRRRLRRPPPSVDVSNGRDQMIAEGIISGKGDGLDGHGNPVKTPWSFTDEELKKRSQVPVTILKLGSAYD